MNDKHSVGFIGTGAMGGGIALNLLKSGYSLAVYDRLAEAMAPLVEAGAQPCGSAAEAAYGKSVVILCLPTEASVLETLDDRCGVLAAMATDGVLINTSTISPLRSGMLANQVERGRRQYLDAPISGGPEGARAGTLSYMVGGDQSIFERCKPIFEASASNIFYMGGAGAGLVTKIAHNLTVFVMVEVIMESIVLAESAGVTRERLLEVMSCSAASRVIDLVRPRIGREQDTQIREGHALRGLPEVLGAALELADEHALPLPLGRRLQDLVEEALEKGHGDLNFFSWWRLLEERVVGR